MLDRTAWDDLSDAELRARLEQRGLDVERAARLVLLRDDVVARGTIDDLLNS